MAYPLPSDIARYIRPDGKPTPDFYRWLRQLDVYATGNASGIPDGGTDGQALVKQSATDGDANWETLTKSSVGLDNVDNTSDASKPVSTATQAALDAKANTADLGTAAAADTTDFDAAGAATTAVATHAALTATHGATGAVVGTTNAQTLTNKTLTAPVINSPTGIVKGDVGLGNVDNTSDATKNAAAVSLTNKNLTSGTNTFPTFNQNTTGSAATLTTARTIDGQSFNGSANITVIAPGTHAATSKATPVDADELPLVDSAASNVLKKLTWANLKATAKTYFDTLYLSATLTRREVLSANRTYYVRTDGSDSNNGLTNTSGGAFLTAQKAADVVGALDISVYDVTVNVGAGTYNVAGTVLDLKAPSGAGTVSFIGDETTPSNVLLNASSSGRAVTCFTNGSFIVAGFKLVGNSSQDAFLSAGTMTLRNCEYAGTANYRIYCQGFGKLTLSGAANKISGGGIGFILSEVQSVILMNSTTWTLTANVTYSGATVTVRRLGYLEAGSVTFTLGAFAVTGARYSNTQNSVIVGTGASASYFPGSTAGTTDASSVYA